MLLCSKFFKELIATMHVAVCALSMAIDDARWLQAWIDRLLGFFGDQRHV